MMNSMIALKCLGYAEDHPLVKEGIAELDKRHRPVAVAVDPSSPAGSLVTDLSQLRRVPPLLLLAGRAYAQACGALYDDVSTVRLAHLGQPALDDAAAGARRRTLGDAWTWSRHDGASADPAPLIAATLVRQAWAQAPRSKPSIL